MTLPQIMVAPNGARLQKAYHPALPLTQEEIVDCAKACYDAGAGGIHAHIRDDQGRHLLDAQTYRKLILAIHAVVPNMIIQITTEAAGRYEASHQMQVALESGATHVSVSIREISSSKAGTVRGFIDACHAKEITLQFILYDREDADLLAKTLKDSELKDPNLQLLFVLGRYGMAVSAPEDIDIFTDWMTEKGITPDWAICAFGQNEPECLFHAVELGGKCRTGFENSVFLSNGTVSPDNASKVQDLRAALSRNQRIGA